MKFRVLVFRDEIIATKFDRMGSDALNAKPAFKDVAAYMMKATEATFQSQGRRGGGSWRRLTPGWLLHKARKGWDLRILHQRYPASNTLRKSVTRPRAGGQILVIEDDFMQLGSRLPYAAAHQYGNSHVPARPYLKFTKRDRERIRNMIRDHLMRAWQKGSTV